MQINTERPARATHTPVACPVAAYRRAAPVAMPPHQIARLSFLLAYVAQLVPAGTPDPTGAAGSLVDRLDAEALQLAARLRSPAALPLTLAEQYEQACVRG